MKKTFKSIGLMSGTSLDGIDAALLMTDGEGVVTPLGFVFMPYPDDVKAGLRPLLGQKPKGAEASVMAHEITCLHAEAVRSLLKTYQIKAEEIDFIGFHGQTIYHAPQEGVTIQLGDGGLLAKLTNIAVISDFRTADVKAGGQGAPLVPVYHRAMVQNVAKPLVVLNLGGVGNITYVGKDGALIACDTGPANALIDDWMLKHRGEAFDDGGAFAKSGKVDEAHVKVFLSDPYFALPAPKSLDRDHFKKYIPHHLSPADGAATLTAMTVMAVIASLQALPLASGDMPTEIIVCGGGRKNNFIMQSLKHATNMNVINADDLKWNGDAIEAEAFAYMAVRSYLGLPNSFPETTGVIKPTVGGMLHAPLPLPTMPLPTLPLKEG
jgi:anhydro-N-acetylmuramic acid kinase